MRMGRAQSRWATGAIAIVAVLVVGLARNAAAGCGCQKPPPPVAEVRPNVTYAGAPVTLFSASLVEGEDYDVTFTSSATGEDTTVSARVVNRRDLGDGVFKNQLVVPVPELSCCPSGPTAWTRLPRLTTWSPRASTVATTFVGPEPSSRTSRVPSATALGA